MIGAAAVSRPGSSNWRKPNADRHERLDAADAQSAAFAFLAFGCTDLAAAIRLCHTPKSVGTRTNVSEEQIPVPSFARLHRLVLAAMAAMALGSAAAQAQAALAKSVSPFVQLGGTWSGDGRVRYADGSSERIRCRAYYNPKDDGNRLGLAIRCASTSYKMEVRATLYNNQGRVTGTWEERNFNASGRATGRASNGNVSLAISGGGLSGTMSVSFRRSSQRVAILTSGANLRGVSMNLTRR
jgi:hypothetical protein